MKKSLKEIALKNMLAKQKKLLKAKRELANLKVQEKAIVSVRNKIRRDNHNHYEPQLTAIRDEIQELLDFLTKI